MPHWSSRRTVEMAPIPLAPRTYRPGGNGALATSVASLPMKVAVPNLTGVSAVYGLRARSEPHTADGRPAPLNP
jgi:hypothetical protein